MSSTTFHTIKFISYVVDEDGKYVVDKSHFVKTTVTSLARDVDRWIEDTLYFHCKHLGDLIVGLDTEWRFVKESDGHQKVAVLQLCVGKSCLIFQIHNADTIPQSLFDFLGNHDILYVGKGVCNDVMKLKQDYGLSVARCLDVAYLAVRQYDDSKLEHMGLKNLASKYLGIEMEKNKRITLSKWDATKLTFGQIKYACLDAFVSFKLGLLLY